jgi:ketosteroid isomerase-like protein
MTKYLWIIPLVFLLCLVVCCQQQGEEAAKELSRQEKDVIARAVEKTVSDYINAVKRIDIEQMLIFWADTEGFVFAGDGSLTVGYDIYANQLREMMLNTAEVTSMEYRNPHIYVLSNDAASLSMEYEWSMISKDGNTINAKGSWMYLFKKFDEVWKVVNSAGTHLYE